MKKINKVKTALISVSDRKNLVGFAKGLAGCGVTIYATSGTADFLASHGIKARRVAGVQGDEILSGRVKTLGRKIFAAVLADRSAAADMKTLREMKIKPFDIVCVNPYAAGEVPHCIDIGGIALLRAAAKNYRFVTPVYSPRDYGKVLDAVKKNGSIPEKLSARLAAEVFGFTAGYDLRIQSGFGNVLSAGKKIVRSEIRLRYGENPDDTASAVLEKSFRQLSGKEMSLNNIIDIEAALGLAGEFSRPACAVIKHRNPCGAAAASTLPAALEKAHAADPVSAWGGVYGFNRPVTEGCARFLKKKFVDCIAAPSFSKGALKILGEKKTVLFAGKFRPKMKTFRQTSLGIITQKRSGRRLRLKTVTAKKPAKNMLADLIFAWKVAKHTTSNAAVIASGARTLAVCGGSPSRVRAVEICGRYIAKKEKNMVLSSDGFLPFDDSVKTAKKMGIRAIIQPGGSIRDAEVIQAADRCGMVMVFTGARCFLH